MPEPGRLPPAGWEELPRPPTSFVGRAEELRAVGALLAGGRVVTLHGPAGAGKTRLSLAVAAGQAARFPDGGHFADLAGLREPELVAGAVATAAGVRERPGQAALPALTSSLRAARAADPRQLRAPRRRLRRGRRRAGLLVPGGRDHGYQPGAARP
jgi:hypothetical protein